MPENGEEEISNEIGYPEEPEKEEEQLLQKQQKAEIVEEVQAAFHLKMIIFSKWMELTSILNLM